mmetsp:Transcript_26157/g.54611  ORF Transcript_26157/g.54611 Transcript_26157/m.54611 type:complete len:467 (-) Transcript_26157:323-1723(-)
MHQPNFNRPVNGRRSTILAILTLFLSISFQQHDVILLASASAVVASPIMAFRRGTNAAITNTAASATETAAPPSATIIAEAGEEALATPNTDTAVVVEEATSTTSTPTSSNPVVQLVNYVKTSCVNFKDGLVQMNTDHKRCKTIRAKQSAYALANGTYRPRGIRGIQTGGISYEEYDFLKKGLVDRNKLFAVGVVSVCLPNYFVYYLWSFPDMMPTPFLKGKDMREISRERCHAVISTMLDIEKGARVAPWTSKLNPFGRKATERAMERLGNCIALGCASLEEYGAVGPNGGRMILKKLRSQVYTSDPPTKQQRLLAGKDIPKQIMKGLTKAIGADPLNKGSSPFGISALKHIESVTLADEFLVNEKVDIESINSALLSEACSARLIGSLGWTDEARKEALASWLQEMEIAPREATSDGKVHYNGNLARAALMCYNVVDGTRDSGADSSLLRVMYQGQKKEPLILN